MTWNNTANKKTNINFLGAKAFRGRSLQPIDEKPATSETFEKKCLSCWLNSVYVLIVAKNVFKLLAKNAEAKQTKRAKNFSPVLELHPQDKLISSHRTAEVEVH